MTTLFVLLASVVVGGDFSANFRDMKLDIDCGPETTCNAGITCIFTPASLQNSSTNKETVLLLCS
jgi:hypothetical protein